jgi:hypothetical protein
MIKQKFLNEPYIIASKKTEFKDISVIGRKGLLFIQNTSKIQTVPFFILSTTAFDNFVSSAKLVDPIVTQICTVDINNPITAETASKNIKKIIEKTPIPTTILDPIKLAFETLKESKKVTSKVLPSFIFEEKYTPTSISTFETKSDSFEDLIKQIKQGWAELFSPAALILRAKKFYQGNLSIALIIQKVINPETTGTAKLKNNQVEIEAIFGCKTPEIVGADKYIVEKNKIKEKYIISQNKLAIRTFEGLKRKYKYVKLNEEYKGVPKLSDTSILKIASLSKEIINSNFIHWEIEAGEIFITNFEQKTYKKLSPKKQEIKTKPTSPQLLNIKVKEKSQISKKLSTTKEYNNVNLSNLTIKNIIDITSMKSDTISQTHKFDGVFFDGTKIILDRRELPEEKYENEVVQATKFIDAIKLDINTAYKVTQKGSFFYKFSDIGDLEKKLLDSKIIATHDERIIKHPMAILPEILAIKEIRSNSGSVNLILPSIRTLENLEKIKAQLISYGLRKNAKTKFYIESYIPSFINYLTDIDFSWIEGIVIPIEKLTQTYLYKNIVDSIDHAKTIETIRQIRKAIPSNTKMIFHLDCIPENNLLLLLTDLNPDTLIWEKLPTQDNAQIILNVGKKEQEKKGRKLKPLFQH